MITWIVHDYHRDSFTDEPRSAIETVLLQSRLFFAIEAGFYNRGSFRSKSLFSLAWPGNEALDASVCLYRRLHGSVGGTARILEINDDPYSEHTSYVLVSY